MIEADEEAHDSRELLATVLVDRARLDLADSQLLVQKSAVIGSLGRLRCSGHSYTRLIHGHVVVLHVTTDDRAHMRA